MHKSKKLHCCERCQNYWTCETKWYRGEHNQENVCCELCQYYRECWGPVVDLTKKTSKG